MSTEFLNEFLNDFRKAKADQAETALIEAEGVLIAAKADYERALLAAKERPHDAQGPEAAPFRSAGRTKGLASL